MTARTHQRVSRRRAPKPGRCSARTNPPRAAAFGLSGSVNGGPSAHLRFMRQRQGKQCRFREVRLWPKHRLSWEESLARLLAARSHYVVISVSWLVVDSVSLLFLSATRPTSQCTHDWVGSYEPLTGEWSRGSRKPITSAGDRCSLTGFNRAGGTGGSSLTTASITPMR